MTTEMRRKIQMKAKKKRIRRTNKEWKRPLEQTKISLFFHGKSLWKLKFYAAIEIIQPFFFRLAPLGLVHSVVFEMETITANILKKQSNFITTFRRHILTNKTLDMHIGSNAARESKL